jgi:integrase
LPLTSIGIDTFVVARARKMRWLTYDPSADLESPEQKAITATAADDIWTPEQMSTFLDHVAAHRLGGCFGLTLLGLRREEVGGLRWSDVALEAGTLRIRQARVDVNGRDTIVATKTERSGRDLPLPPHELAMLKAMRTAHLRERLAVGHLSPTMTVAFAGRRHLVAGSRILPRVHRPAKGGRAQGNHARQAAALEYLPDTRGRYAADVVAAWHGHTERMTQAVYGPVTDDRLTAASAVFSTSAVGQN